MCSHGLDSLRSLSAIETQNLPQNSQGGYARQQERPRTSPQPTITHEQMDNRNAPISGWSNICDSGSTSGKITGMPTYPWRSSYITIGQTKQLGSPLSLCCMD